MLREDIVWPPSRRFQSSSPHEPVEFFTSVLCNATTFDLMLGFFSSSAISVLSSAFAVFLGKNGRMRLLINTFLSPEDTESLKGSGSKYYVGGKEFNLSDLRDLASVLSKRDRHFFECLSWLIAEKRIEIKVIRPKGKSGIPHTKCGILGDGESHIAFDGSCNFSKTALIDNYESINVFCEWDDARSEAVYKEIRDNFEKTFTGAEDSAFEFVDLKDVEEIITDTFPARPIEDLLQQEKELNDEETELPLGVTVQLKKAYKYLLEECNKPKFPFEAPRPYQEEALNNWLANGQKGFFAMATGTGKTLTALNCLLEIYKRRNYYKAIVLVPTLPLAEQWVSEVKRFRFKNIVVINSKSKAWQDQFQDIIRYERNGLEYSYVIICTYKSFAKAQVFNRISELPQDKVLLIADEAHNMGSPEMLKLMGRIHIARRIGLSATPERPFQEETNASLLKFFGADKGMTFEFSMKRAIEEGFLCRYVYHPRIVYLTDEETEKYKEISKRIAIKYAAGQSISESSGDTELLAYLLARKRILHKAENKLEAFNQILDEEYTANNGLQYCLVYAPEGNAEGYDGNVPVSEPLIDRFTRAVRDLDPAITVRQFKADTEDREQILRDFSAGRINVLTSMKCLDEGVDVPRAQLAIFCASTGNPRQYIQRRGRVLRKHPKKARANIYDMLVLPASECAETLEVEKKLVGGELARICNFASLAENKAEILEYLLPTLRQYQIPLEL